MSRKVIVRLEATLTLDIDEGTSIDDVLSQLDVSIDLVGDVSLVDFNVENYKVLDSK